MAVPLITVSVPTYNRSALLAETITSILNQTYGDFQLLICDNASTDDTRQVVEAFRDPRIVYHRHERNLGMNLNWRFALTHPQSRYVAMTSDDDLYLPNHLAAAVELLERDSQATVYGCGTEMFGEGTPSLYGPPWMLELKEPEIFRPAERYTIWLRRDPIAACSAVVRRAAMDQIQHWGGQPFASLDWLWWGQLAAVGNFIFNPALGARYRWHQSNYTRHWATSGIMGCESRYVIRTLAEMAHRQGLFSPEQLVREALSWSAREASTLVTTLAGGEVEPALRKAAMEIYRSHPTIRGKEASLHTRVAGWIGAWYLRHADHLDRWRAGWPPKDAK